MCGKKNSLLYIIWLYVTICRNETAQLTEYILKYGLLTVSSDPFKVQWLLYVTYEKLYVLPTQCIYVFCMYLRTAEIISL